MNKKKKCYPYNLQMEITSWEYNGKNKTSHGMASAYQNPRHFKDECLKIIGKIKKRIIQVVTNDEILKATLLDDLDNLKSDIKKIVKENSEPHVIAVLLKLIAHLLGWDYFEGKFFRTPIFHQTEEQRHKSLEKAASLHVPSEVLYRRRRLILKLRKEELNYQKIALILGMTDSSVKSLEEAKHIDKWYKEEIERKDNS